jgi:hypothetical protein
MSPKWGSTLRLTDWPTVSRNVTDFDFDVWESCQEFGRVLEMTAQGDWEEMTRKELGDEKKTSCVIWSDSETVINPLPG